MCYTCLNDCFGLSKYPFAGLYSPLKAGADSGLAQAIVNA
jgi:hypothetical protein